MNWMQTHSGRVVVLNPGAAADAICDVFVIEDIALALSRLCRFNGHTRRFYSVAEHSVLCSWLAGSYCELRTANRLSLLALLHDAAEAYIGDLIRPVKRLTVGHHALELVLQARILKALGVEPPTPGESELISRVDRIMLLTEVRELMPPCAGYLELDEANEPTELVRPVGLSSEEAEALFLHRWRELRGSTHNT